MFKRMVVLACLMLSAVSFAEGLKNIDVLHAIKTKGSIFEYAQVNSPVAQDLGFSVRGIPANFAYLLTTDGHQKSLLVVGIDSMVNQDGGKAIKQVNDLASLVTDKIEQIASKYNVKASAYAHAQDEGDSLRVIDMTEMTVENAAQMIKDLQNVADSLGKNADAINAGGVKFNFSKLDI